MIVRKLIKEDLDKYYSTLKKLMIDTYINNFEIMEIQAEKICIEKLGLLAVYINDGSATVVASFEGNEMIGFIWIYKHCFLGEMRFHVNQIAVKSGFRGKGVGKRLFQEVEDLARIEEIKTIDLFVSEINVEALGLYNKLDFEVERKYMKKELR